MKPKFSGRAIGTVWILISACGGDGSGPGWQGTVDTLPGGRIVVTNPATGLWSADEAWRLEPVTRIGAVEGDGPDIFGQVIAVELDGEGRVYAIDRQAQEVRVFDPAGRYVRTIGNEGEGPGEFTGANGLGWGPEDNLWVVDQRLRRFTLFDTSGTMVDTRLAPNSIVSFAWEGWFRADGRIVDRGLLRAEPWPRTMFMTYDGESAYTDTLVLPPFTPETFGWQSEGRGAVMQIPFSPQPIWVVSPDGYVWMSEAREYVLHHTTFEGDTVLTIVRDAPPIPVRDAEREEAIGRIETFMRGNRYEAARIPAEKPPLQRIFVDEEGSVWVLRPDSAGAPGSTLDVFDPTGRYLGEVVTSAPMVPWPRFVVRGGRIAYVTTDELDVQYVVVERVVRGASAAKAAAGQLSLKRRSGDLAALPGPTRHQGMERQC